MLHEAEPLEHTDRPRSVLRRHHQIRVAVRTHLIRIQPHGEHRTLEHKHLNPVTAERAGDLGSKHIDREVARSLLVTLVTFRAHRKAEFRTPHCRTGSPRRSPPARPASRTSKRTGSNPAST